MGFYSDTGQSIAFKCSSVSGIGNSGNSPVLMWVLLSIATIVIFVWVIIAIVKCKFKKNRKILPKFVKVLKNDKFPLIAFKDLEKSEAEECSICQQKFEAASLVRVLECTHFYHQNCIDEWFQGHQFCCICKREYNNNEYFHNLAEEPNRTQLFELGPLQRENWVDNK
jgi:hypothetical protein